MKLPGGVEIRNAPKELEDLLQARGRFILKYCLEKEWNPESLNIKQILEIRAQDGWKNPLRPATPTQEMK